MPLEVGRRQIVAQAKTLVWHPGWRYREGIHGKSTLAQGEDNDCRASKVSVPCCMAIQVESNLVPGTGIEPVRSCDRGILSPLRLPISPPGQIAGAERNTRGRIVMQRPGDSYEPGHQHEPNSQVIAAHIIVILSVKIAKRSRGGWGRNRTGVRGVAVRCMTTLPPSPRSTLVLRSQISAVLADKTQWAGRETKDPKLERETRLELATPTLARSCSTN
ncbi:MAG: hypothetical protein RL572_602 [Pseudomonadota bacterium]